MPEPAAITAEAVAQRRYWVSEIVNLSGSFGDDSARVERELQAEIERTGSFGMLDHLRLCGVIPEEYNHDSSEEKLYSKYTDVVLALAFRQLGLKSLVLTERADAADVEVVADSYAFVADAKAFRLSRTAKNQKDFKIQALDGWRRDKRYAVVVAPMYQLPSRASQIYLQAVSRNVCILSFSHLAVLVALAQEDQQAAQQVLDAVLECVEALTPTKDAVSYWTVINRQFINFSDTVAELWLREKRAGLDALEVGKAEALTYLAAQREAILRLSHEEAVQQLLALHRIESRTRVIQSVVDTGLLGLSEAGCTN